MYIYINVNKVYRAIIKNNGNYDMTNRGYRKTLRSSETIMYVREIFESYILFLKSVMYNRLYFTYTMRRYSRRKSNYECFLCNF